MADSKVEIRREMQLRRRSLAPAEVSSAEACVFERLRTFAPFAGASTVVAYAATDNEVPTARILEWAEQSGKRVLLPRVDGDRLVLVAYRATEDLRPGRFGVPEPLGTGLDWPNGDGVVVLVPLVAWDRTGTRLGRGGGFYDRALAGLKGGATLIGVAYGFQQHRSLPCDSWDVRLDYVVTEEAIVRCESRTDPVHIQKEEERNHGERVVGSTGCGGTGSGAGVDDRRHSRAPG